MTGQVSLRHAILAGGGEMGELMFVHAVEVTDLVRARQAARDDAQLVETLHRVGTTLAAELDLDRVVQAVTDAATEATGAEFGAFLYYVVDAGEEAYTLSTTVGVSRERFSQFPMPRPRFSGTAVVRLDDVRQDARFATNPPSTDLPEDSLAVHSYLAVPVRSRSGEVLGGLFFGHERVGMFTERDERLAVGIASQASVTWRDWTWSARWILSSSRPTCWHWSVKRWPNSSRTPRGTNL